MKLLYIETIIWTYVLNMLLSASKEDSLRNPCELLPSEPGGAVTPPIGTPSLHTPFSVDRYLWFHSQCVHCLRMEMVRWRGSRHLQGAVTGFSLVSPGALRHAGPYCFACYSSRAVSSDTGDQPACSEKNFSVDVCILDASVFDQMSKSTKSVFFLLLYFPIHTQNMCLLSRVQEQTVLPFYVSRQFYLSVHIYSSISTSLCAGSGVTGNCLWLGNSHKVTHSPVALVWQGPGRFNPSVLRINLMFLDSLAQSKGPDGTLCPLRKAQRQAKGWSTEGEAHLFNNPAKRLIPAKMRF